ncbi:MAG: MetQ/NlpA family ABC transporter substrate-binding protein [Oscillospiraceae bacterium]
MKRNNIFSRIPALLLSATLALTGCSATENSSSGSTPDSSAPAESGSAANSTTSDTVTVKLGIMGGGDEEIWKPAKEALAAEGIELEYVFFTDYTQPNAALANGDIDLNAFQHYKYLNTEIEQFGYDITSIGDTYISATNVYSSKITDLSQIKEGDKIAVANDAVNLGRALNVLQAAGLLTVDSSKGLVPAVSDITSNPLNLEIVEVDASQTPSLLPDVAAAVINGDYAVDSGLSPANDAIFYDNPSYYTSNDYVNVIAARTADKDNEIYKKVVKAYQTDATEQVYNTTFQGTYIAAWKSAPADSKPAAENTAFEITDRTANPVTVKLGIMGASDELVWDPIIAEFGEKGVTIEKVFFTDYTQPNAALANGDIDLNSFQHYTYLNKEKETFGYDITAIGDTLITALNIYSKKISSIDEIKDGDKIALPNDAVNENRALNVIQAAGLIKLDPNAELATVGDITENPKNLEFVEVDASQTPSLLPDVAAAVINGGYAIDAGLSPRDDSIFFDDPSFYKTNAYVNIIAARTEDKDNELYKEIVKAYQSDRTKEIYANDFQGSYIPAWED